MTIGLATHGYINKGGTGGGTTTTTQGPFYGRFIGALPYRGVLVE